MNSYSLFSTLTSGFDPIDQTQVRLLGNLPSHRRLRLMLDARELAVGLMRGRLRRCFPDLSESEINLKLIEEFSHAD